MKKLLLATSLVCVAGAALARPPVDDDSTARLVVRYKAGVVQAAEAGSTPRMKALGVRAKHSLRHMRTMASGAHVLALDGAVSMREARAIATRLKQDPSIESVEPDVRVKAFSAPLPNDKYATRQWALPAPSGTVSGSANFLDAWTTNKGAGVVVAVIDTGSRPHQDMPGTDLPGYDFISDGTMAGDGDARDADPSDAGDYCTTQAGTTDSSWHGLRVAGQIAAIPNNGYGVAGAAPSVKLVPARALGRCGGYMSDVADALAWSAGAPVAGVPANSSPAQVINMSLGDSSGMACPVFMQTAVDAALGRGAIVVAAAGNEGRGSLSAPASCAGVISVGAHTKGGDLADYSNHAPGLTLTAPGGGNCKALTGTACDSEPTLSVSNTGVTGPGADAEGIYFAGTSAATPHVVAAVALLKAANPALTSDQVKSILQTSARTHPVGTFCATYKSECGAGMLDAAGALSMLDAPAVQVGTSYNTAAVPTKRPVTLKMSAQGRNPVVKYHWVQVSGEPVALSGADSEVLAFTTGSFRGDLVFEAQATDAYGMVGKVRVTVRVNDMPVLTTTNLAGTQGIKMTETLVATDANMDTTTFAVLEAPAGLTVTKMGTLEWTPAFGGTFVVKLQLQDVSDFSTIEQTLTISIKGAPEPEAPAPGSPGTPGTGDSATGGGEGGGGGSADILLLGLLGGAAFAARRRK